MAAAGGASVSAGGSPRASPIVSIAAAARRVRARQQALEQLAKQQARQRAREEEQRAAERAAARRRAERDSELTAERHRADAVAAAARAERAAESRALQLARSAAAAANHASGDGNADQDAALQLEAVECVRIARRLCGCLRECPRTHPDAHPSDAAGGAGGESIAILPLAARFVACYRRQSRDGISEGLSGPHAADEGRPPIRAMYHGTRAAILPSILHEGLRLPDGESVRHSTSLSLRHGGAASGTARIFATLNFARAALHAKAPSEPATGASALTSAWHTPPAAPVSSPRPARDSSGGSGACIGACAWTAGTTEPRDEHGHTSGVLLVLTLPAGAGPCDHAKTTFMFADEAQLLPCFLPTDAQDAEGLAGRALNAARQALLEVER